MYFVYYMEQNYLFIFESWNGMLFLPIFTSRLHVTLGVDEAQTFILRISLELANQDL